MEINSLKTVHISPFTMIYEILDGHCWFVLDNIDLIKVFKPTNESNCLLKTMMTTSISSEAQRNQTSITGRENHVSR